MNAKSNCSANINIEYSDENMFTFIIPYGDCNMKTEIVKEKVVGMTADGTTSETEFIKFSEVFELSYQGPNKDHDFSEVIYIKIMP